MFYVLRSTFIILPMTDPQDRLLNPERKPDDRADYARGPKLLKDLIGQERVKENLQIREDAAKNLGILSCKGQSLDVTTFSPEPTHLLCPGR